MMEIIRLQDGRELSYTVFGVRNPEPGRTIIYFHGFMSSRLEAAMLQDRALDLGIRIVAADRSGYGDSTYDPHRTPHSAVKDVEQLLEALLPPDEKVVFYGVSGGSPYAAACAALLQNRAHGLLLNVPFALIAGREEKVCVGLSKTATRMFRDVKINPIKVKITLYMASLLQRTPLRFLLLKYGGFSKVDIETQKLFKNKGGALNLAGREGNKRGLKGQFLDLQIMATHSHESLTGLLGSVTCKSVVWAGAMDCTTPAAMAHSYANKGGAKMAKDKSSKQTVATREYTINLHKRLHGQTFKKRAPKAVKEIKKFAQKMMSTPDVRVDVKLNKAVWSQGIRNVPNKVRIVIQRRRNEDDEDSEEMYSLVTLAEDQNTKGKGVVVLEA
ncbi:hypothetical protein Ndes2437B_g02555 [Nannochloris sp. 'desiccata']